jgi:hypothetical protein
MPATSRTSTATACTLLGQHDDDGREGVLRQSAAALYGL